MINSKRIERKKKIISDFFYVMLIVHPDHEKITWKKIYKNNRQLVSGLRDE